MYYTYGYLKRKHLKHVVAYLGCSQNIQATQQCITLYFHKLNEEKLHKDLFPFTPFNIY